ncbi:MAG TPA: ribosome biogenesis GTPase YlqF [Clostridiales bacterium]|nr:ribosome biogenesis GTPase YlqF [Clostridiales bacterium]
MHIQWFPGHMTKALREIKSELSRVDSVIYLLDARAPKSSLNPELDEILSQKPTLYVLNKSDLVNQKSLQKWKNYFTSSNSNCLYMNSLKLNNTKYLLDEIIKINKDKIESYKRKGANVKISAMVVGIPNSGKSTLINNIAGKYKAKRQNKPGTTKGQQFISVNKNINLIDSPGVLYPSFEDQHVALKLGMIGSISDEVVDQVELSKKIISLMSKNFPNDFTSRYNNININDMTIDEIFNAIAISRGAILKEDKIDKERTAKIIIGDFRSGRLGLVCLDDIEFDDI